MKTLSAHISAYVTNRGRSKACRILRTMSNRQLEDMGFDPHLIQQGPSAWPWKAGK